MNIVLETRRLFLRFIAPSDFSDLAEMFRDPRVMYAWEHTFSDEEIREWIGKNLSRYGSSGLSHYLAVEKKSGVAVGYAGLLEDSVRGQRVYEISYMLKHRFWHRGFAREAASALARYAFQKLGLHEVVFEIRPENEPSARVARSLGAVPVSSFAKSYRGKEMLHALYLLKSGKESHGIPETEP